MERLDCIKARKLVELHGGRIEAFSEGEERGSEFRIYLPLKVNL
jgi:signal transduction histidine kinase